MNSIQLSFLSETSFPLQGNSNKDNSISISSHQSLPIDNIIVQQDKQEACDVSKKQIDPSQEQDVMQIEVQMSSKEQEFYHRKTILASEINSKGPNNSNNIQIPQEISSSQSSSVHSSQLFIIDKIYTLKILSGIRLQNKLKIEPFLIFFVFILLQFIGPIFSFWVYEKLSKKVSNKKFLICIQIYNCFSSVILWIACLNYSYLRVKSTVQGEEFDFLISEYHKIFLYLGVISVCFAILGRTSFENNVFALLLFNQMKYETKRNLTKTMKDLLISEHDFIFQFISGFLENEQKAKQVRQIKRVIVLPNKISNLKRQPEKEIEYQTNFDSSQIYYSGLDLCYQIVRKSQIKNIGTFQFISIQVIVTLVVYFKAIQSVLYRLLFFNKDFIVYNIWFTLIPFLCSGQIIGQFARTICETKDLSFIHDYNKAISGLLCYDSYLGLNPRHYVCFPSFNPLDITTLKTWAEMRNLLNHFKKTASQPVDRCTLFLFGYLTVIFFGIFLSQLYNKTFLGQAESKYLVPYYLVDVVLISILFTYRVQRQTVINQQYRQQLKLVQMVKNMLVKLLLFRESYEEKNDRNDMQQIIEQDPQWRFYAELNRSYQQVYFHSIHENRRILKNHSDAQNDSERIQENKNQDYENLLKYTEALNTILEEISTEIARTPMKFLGLLPSSYGLMITFLYMISVFIYMVFYLYFQNSERLVDQ